MADYLTFEKWYNENAEIYKASGLSIIQIAYEYYLLGARKESEKWYKLEKERATTRGLQVNKSPFYTTGDQ